MSDLHDEFEAWYEENEDNRRSLRSLRTSESYLPTNFYLCGCFEGWKASRAEFSALAASHQRLKEALGAVLCMLPSDHEDRPADERIPASYCYVRWQDIREAREALRSTP